MWLEVLDLDPLQIACGGHATSHLEHVADTRRPSQLIDSRAFDIARNANHRANRRDEDCVTRLDAEVTRPLSSQLSKKSYRSKVPIVRLLRISLIVRSDPSLLSSPAANRACTMVESELTVYVPGWATSPTTNT